MNTKIIMKFREKVSLTTITLVLLCSNTVFGQKAEKFDIITYKAPAGWQKEVAKDAIQFGIDDKNGGSCLISMFKSVEASNNSKINFDAAWENIIEKMVALKSPLEMQPSATENGWTAESGFAEYESDGVKGLVMLVTLTGNSKMVNILALMNTDAYQQPITDFLEAIVLPKIENPEIPSTHKIEEQAKTVKKTGFKFNETKFDDGWTATEQEDWVEVSKGYIRVLIHYPNKATDEYMPDGEADMRRAWDNLIAPRYRDASGMFMKYSGSLNVVDFVEADVTAQATGKRVHVVMFRMQTSVKGRVLEFITPDKRTFEQEFGAYHEGTSGWEKVANMEYRNKFAVSPNDLNGRWTTDFSASIQYVNEITGADVGTDTQASVQNFLFGPGNAYQWDIGVSSGRVGSIKFDSAKSGGKFSMLGNWQISFSNIEGKARTYDAFFTCVKGGRILMLDNHGFGKAK